MEGLTRQEAAARVRTADTLGLPLAPGGLSLSQRSLICMPSTVVTAGQVRSRIVP